MNSSQRYEHLAETGSTNQDLLDLAQSGTASPTALLTDHQSAGRGRLGRSWHNDRQSIGPVQAMMGSVRQDWPVGHPNLAMMPFAVGLAARAACMRWVNRGAPLGLKWPNDLVVGVKEEHDPPSDPLLWFRKVAGILVETVPLARRVAEVETLAVVAGVGINLHPVSTSQDQPKLTDAASLSELCSVVPTNTQLFEALLEEFDRFSAMLRSEPHRVIAEYRTHCETVGHTVRTIMVDGPRIGEALDIADDGALIVDWGDGVPDRVTYGDVSISS